MADRNIELIKLKELIKSVREYYAKPGLYDLDKLVSQRICPELGRLVNKICIEIDSTHEIINPKTDKRIMKLPRFCGRFTVWDSGSFREAPFEVHG